MADNANIELKLKDVRLSFADIFDAKAFGDDPDAKPRFSANFLIPKDTPEGKALVEQIKTAMKTVIATKWPTDAPKLKGDKLCLRDGEPKDEDSGQPEELYEGYAGHFFLSAASSEDKPPVIVDSRKGADGKFPVLTKASGRPYAGCYVNAVVRIWAQDNKWGKRVNASLEAIQFFRHGDAFSGAKPVDANSVFDDAGADDDFAPDSPAGADDLLG